MSGTTDVTLGSLLAATTIPAGAGVVIRLPSSTDPSKYVFGILTVQALNGGSTGGGTTVSAPVNSATPTITGPAQQGQTLTASPGTWSGSPIYTYQWLRSGSVISGATGSSYTLTSADVGSTISVQVTASNSAGSANSASASTGTVAAAATGGGTTTPPVTSTRARFAQDTATAGTSSTAAALFASMTQVANPSSDRNGTMTTTADQAEYTWVAVLASAAGSGMRFFDGTGYGGFNGAASSSVYFDDDSDPTTIHQTYTDSSGNAWNLYRSSGHSVAATFTLS